MAKLRVLIVGAGKRVQNNFLPALRCLSDRFEIVGVHARTAANLSKVADLWDVPAVFDLQHMDWSTVDVVAVSVPVSQNPVVLRQLTPYGRGLRLVIDTPVATTLHELLECDRLLPEFREVLVAEDYMNFPLFSLIRLAAKTGLIGNPRAATLFNTGYSFHGLALIRSFANFRFAWRSETSLIGTFTKNIAYHLNEGFKGSVIGPYRPKSNGGLILEGDSGVITESSTDERWGNTGNRRVYTAREIMHDGDLAGYVIENTSGEPLFSTNLPFLQALRAMPFDDKSNFNLCKGCGLIDVFLALLEPDNMNNSYGPDNALYDSFVSRIAARRRLLVDPPVLGRSTVMTALRTLASFRRLIRGAP